jgi:hypothetical protein
MGIQICLESYTGIPLSGVHRFSKNVKGHLNVLGARRITWCKFHSLGSQILGATAQSLVVQATWRPRILPPYTSSEYYRILVKILPFPTSVSLNSSILLQFLLTSDRTFVCLFNRYIYGNGNCYKSYFYFIENTRLVNYEVTTAAER